MQGIASPSLTRYPEPNIRRAQVRPCSLAPGAAGHERAFVVGAAARHPLAHGARIVSPILRSVWIRRVRLPVHSHTLPAMSARP